MHHQGQGLACGQMPFIHAAFQIGVLLQVVPTSYTDIKNKTVSTNQFSVTEHFRQSDIAAGQNLPGVFFFYDLSPIKVCKPLRAHFVP